LLALETKAKKGLIKRQSKSRSRLNGMRVRELVADELLYIENRM
jgi:hypothetical protein